MVLFWYVSPIFHIFQQPWKLRSYNKLQKFKHIASFSTHNPTHTYMHHTHTHKHNSPHKDLSQDYSPQCFHKSWTARWIANSSTKFWKVSPTSPWSKSGSWRRFDTTKPYSIIDKLVDSPSIHHTKYPHTTNTITSTIFSRVSHPLFTMTTTATHSTINTTSPTPATRQNDRWRNTTPVHTPATTISNKFPTTHILKTLRQHATITIPSTYT